MQKHIQGTLRDPTGRVLPNHEIRITSRSGITELHSVELTNSNGEYSFILTEGWKYLEVLFRNTYLLVGDILINEAAPAECTIEEILRYSTPIVVSSIYDLPTGINSLQETLEDGTYTFKREDRDQLIDTLVYKVDLTNSWVSDDMLERGMRDISEVSTCDSSIKDIKQVYSDDKGNSFSHSTGSIKTKNGEVKNEVLVSDTIRVNEDITLGNYSYNLSKDVNATTVANSSTKTKGSVVIQDSDTFTDTSLTKTKYATTGSGTFTDITNLNSGDYTHNTSFNNIHQTTITINDTLVQDSRTVNINGIVSTDVFTHDGTSTQRNINIDKYVVGREGNDLFEVDSTTDTVTVRGNLRIRNIQDPDGNSLIPDDGDTIFQVFRYGETSTGPWEDVLQSYHYWKQENYSVNGYIDPNGWSVAYKFKGEDITGDKGDTIFYEYLYSPDGATNWSSELKAGDAYRKERKVVNGVPEEWSNPVRIKGDNGDEIEIRSQYSIDGINNWHTTFLSTDKYERRARFVNGLQNSAWSDPFKIQGTAVFKSIVFKRSAVEPDKPTGGTFDSSIPDGWEDGIPAGELQLWGSTRIFTSDGTPPQEAEWSAPQIMTDTSTLDYEYSAISLGGNPGNPTTDPTNWHNTATPADNWMALRKKTNGVFGEWAISQIKGEKGEPGQDGDTVYEIYQYSVTGTSGWHEDFVEGDLYRRTATVTNGVTGTWSAATRITGYTPVIINNPDGSVTISNGTETAIVYDGENAPIPTLIDNGDGTYTIDNGAGDSVTISNGADGAAGYNSATVYLYQRKATVPNKPSTTSTYNFNTKTITGFNNGWSTSIPNGNDDLYVIVATASSRETTDNILGNEWTSPSILTANGEDGENGFNVATVFLYKRSETEPTKPTVQTTFTFSSGTLTGQNNGWTQTVPSGIQPVYITTATASSQNATDIIPSSEWATPEILAQNGETPVKGVDYFDGLDGSFVSNIYRTSSTGTPSTPNGGSFNGTTETFPTGWQDTPYYESGKITYISTTRYKETSSGVWQHNGWSVPSEYIVKGDKGESAFTNLIKTEGQWVVGTSGSQGIFGKQGQDAQNRIINANGPMDTIEPVWEGSGTSIYQAGGFSVPVYMDINKSYRYSVWIKEDANNDHTIYWGPRRSVTVVPDNTESSNPYFVAGVSLPVPDKWYLAVAILHANEYTGGISGISGIYDPDTGELVYSRENEYKGSTQHIDQGMRVFRYAAETGSTKAYFCRPRIEEINGEEMSLGALMGRIPKDGQDGDPGIPGLNGSGWYSIVNGSGTWPGDAQATANFINTFGRVPQLDDHLFYVDRDTDPTNTDGRRCITPAGGSPVRWSNPRAYFDGDVIVKGTLSADRLVAQSITGNEIDSQTTIIAGSGSSTAGINGYDLSTLPDWMGGGSNPYAGYRFWAGSSTPEFANFTVDNNGKMKAIDGEFSGTITMIGSSGLKVESNNPFGPDNLLEWRGSREGKLNADGTVNLNLLTRVNATTYYSDDNVAYFGGTIIAGTLTLAKTNPSTSTTVEIATGNFGSNGGQIAIACGFSYSFSNPYVAGTCPVPEPSPPVVTLKLYAVSSGGVESLVNSQTFTGTYECLQEGPEYFENATIIGSFTHFDNEYSTNDRSYILKATRTGVTPQSQRLSIVTQE